MCQFSVSDDFTISFHGWCIGGRELPTNTKKIEPPQILMIPQYCFCSSKIETKNLSYGSMPGLMVESSAYLSFSLVPVPASDVTDQLFVIVLTQWRRHVGRVCLIEASHRYVTHTHWKILWTGSTWRTSTEKTESIRLLSSENPLIS